MTLCGFSFALLVVENCAHVIRVPPAAPGAGQLQLLADTGHFVERYPRYPFLGGLGHLALSGKASWDGRCCQSEMRIVFRRLVLCH